MACAVYREPASLNYQILSYADMAVRVYYLRRTVDKESMLFCLIVKVNREEEVSKK
jgi:hypothetical protein